MVKRSDHRRNSSEWGKGSPCRAAVGSMPRYSPRRAKPEGGSRATPGKAIEDADEVGRDHPGLRRGSVAPPLSGWRIMVDIAASLGAFEPRSTSYYGGRLPRFGGGGFLPFSASSVSGNTFADCSPIRGLPRRLLTSGLQPLDILGRGSGRRIHAGRSGGRDKAADLLTARILGRGRLRWWAWVILVGHRRAYRRVVPTRTPSR